MCICESTRRWIWKEEAELMMQNFSQTSNLNLFIKTWLDGDYVEVEVKKLIN